MENNKTKKFINKANAVHGNKYNYSVSKYIDAHSKLKILCPVHGAFLQTANDHLSGCGCPKCGYEVVSKKRTLTQEGFIKKAIEVHGDDNYSYTKTIYVNALTDVVVTCKIHGILIRMHTAFYRVMVVKDVATTHLLCWIALISLKRYMGIFMIIQKLIIIIVRLKCVLYVINMGNSGKCLVII